MDWIIAVNRQGQKQGQLWKLNENSLVCVGHFRDEDIYFGIGSWQNERLKLKPSAVPCQFLGYDKEKEENESQKLRSERREKRAATKSIFNHGGKKSTLKKFPSLIPS